MSNISFEIDLWMYSVISRYPRLFPRKLRNHYYDRVARYTAK